MANNFNNINDVGTVISKMAAGYLIDNLQFCKTIEKEPEESFKSINGYKPGDTININVPAILQTQSDNLDVTSLASDFQERSIPFVLNKTETIKVDATSLDLKTDISENELLGRGERVLKPAMEQLAHKVESRVIELASDSVYQCVGTAGSTVFDTATILSAKDELNYSLCPLADRKLLLGTKAMSSAVNARKGLFQSSEDIQKQYKMGYVGTADGFDYLSNELLNTHTNGNDVSFEVSTTVSTEGQATLVVEGLTTTTGTVTKGTVFTIDTVNQVHPQTKADLGKLQQFVVTADATANGSGITTLSISPAIYTSASGGKQNVTAFPADGDTCNVKTGSASTGYVNNLAYHPSAFRLLTTKLFQPTSAEMSGVASQDGITVNMFSYLNGDTRKLILRFDVLFAFSAIRPEWACRITS